MRVLDLKGTSVVHNDISFQFCICVFIFVYLYFVSESIGFERHLSCTAICISSQGASQALGPEVEKYKCNRKVYEQREILNANLDARRRKPAAKQTDRAALLPRPGMSCNKKSGQTAFLNSCIHCFDVNVKELQ